MAIDHGTPPPIPQEFQQYDSYAEDPKWQTRFTIMWCAPLALCVLLGLPRLVRGLRNGRALAGTAGVRVASEYAPLFVLSSAFLWSLPGLNLNIGQILTIATYSTFALVCIIFKAPLVENPNRAGFLALAQLPPVFLFATKNSLVSLLLGPGADYTKLNYLHRWASRTLFLACARTRRAVWSIPIIGRQKEGSGVAALACICIIVLTSIAPVRRWSYSAFLVLQYAPLPFLTFPAFFITLCYHTIYATPWIFRPSRSTRSTYCCGSGNIGWLFGRVRAVDGQMTLPAAWRAGQHIQVRALFGARVWEAHPLSIVCAPPETTCLADAGPLGTGMILGARACGDWSRALNAFAATSFAGPADLGTDVHLILDGPYGGSSLDAGAYERRRDITLGILDDLVGRCVRRGRAGGERTRWVEWVWCVRSFGAIAWFAPQLLQIATMAQRGGGALVLSIRIYVTCICDPDALPDIPNCVVTLERPDVGRVLGEMMGETPSTSISAEGSASASTEELSHTHPEKSRDVEGGFGQEGGGGGIAVIVSGPPSLIREAGNVVARANASRGGRLVGGVDFCGEVFSV
ncbi:iron reductase [Mycena rebaudengoi]|nr:iron reductase [Mycena rebaudengoi]